MTTQAERELRKKLSKPPIKWNMGCIGVIIVFIILAIGIIYNFRPSAADIKSAQLQEQADSIDAKNEELKKNDPYSKMEVAFEGYPSRDMIQPMMEAVMANYNFAITDDNILHFANMLVGLKNQSKIGITEMIILKHMYQHGKTGLTISQQGARSAAILEKYN